LGERRGLLGALLIAAAGLGLFAAGCGGGDASGARVIVYVAEPSCAEARTELEVHGAEAGHFKVGVRCQDASAKAGGGVDLATVGANSRVATENTAAVAALEPPGRANEFARPILESAGIPLVTNADGRAGMKRILEAIDGAGTSDVRSSVRKALEPS
jgi:hypothetical protein